MYKRQDNTTRDEFDFVVGVEGSVFDDNALLDAYVRHYYYSASELGDTYIVQSILEDLVATGAYDVVNPASPANAAGVLASSATLTRDLDTTFNQVGVTVLVATHDLPLISRMRHRIITLNAGLLAGTAVM